MFVSFVASMITFWLTVFTLMSAGSNPGRSKLQVKWFGWECAGFLGGSPFNAKKSEIIFSKFLSVFLETFRSFYLGKNLSLSYKYLVAQYGWLLAHLKEG